MIDRNIFNGFYSPDCNFWFYTVIFEIVLREFLSNQGTNVHSLPGLFLSVPVFNSEKPGITISS
jgi:hypothetical protein